MLKKKITALAFIYLLMTGSTTLVFAWGAWGHKHINRGAVFALPQRMMIFYYNHIDFITEGSFVPDMRRGVLNDKEEGPRHYVDIEDFGNIPFDSLPGTTADAYLKYDSATLKKNGHLPWYIQTLTEKLTQAFKKKNKSEILFISAELGHYIADAHMPLHTSANYDGQKTNQRGVHALWESRLPELYGSSFNFHTDTATYITDVPAETWRIIAQSHGLVNSLLSTEKQARDSFGKENLYKKDTAGKVILFYNQPVFSNDYSRKFYESLNGMIEQQLRLSIKDLANYWYTAWINGGSPDLTAMDNNNLTRQNVKNFKAEYKAWKQGKMLNLGNNDE